MKQITYQMAARYAHISVPGLAQMAPDTVKASQDPIGSCITSILLVHFHLIKTIPQLNSRHVYNVEPISSKD